MAKGAGSGAGGKTTLVQQQRQQQQTDSTKGVVTKCVDGNAAAAYIAQALSKLVLVYPASSSSVGGDLLNKKSNQLNCFNEVCTTQRLDTTLGAGQALLGSLSTGALASLCCAAPSLPSMLPRLHTLVSKRDPCVLHVAAHGVDPTHLSLSNDLSSVLSVANTGFGMLQSFSAQEAHDMALVAHIAAVRTALPFVHYFDGVRTAIEVSKSDLLSFDKLASLTHTLPKTDVLDATVSRVPRRAIPGIVNDIMGRLRGVLGRRYNLFEYHGAPNATRVVVALCGKEELSALNLAATALSKRGQPVGVLAVRMFRPWSLSHFVEALNVATLGRAVVFVGSKSQMDARALYADVTASIRRQNANCKVLQCKLSAQMDYGSALSLFSQMGLPNPGPVLEIESTESLSLASLSSAVGFTKSIFWDLQDSPTSETATELAVAIGNQSSGTLHTLRVSDSYQLGGATYCTQVLLGRNGSYLSRIQSEEPLPSLETLADFVACHDVPLMDRYAVTDQLKDLGTLLINTSLQTQDELEGGIPAQIRREMAARGLKLFLLDASALAGTLPFAATASLALKAAFLIITDVDPSLATRALVESGALNGEHVRELFGTVSKALVKYDVPQAWIADGIAPPQTTDSADDVDAVQPPPLVSRVINPSAVTVAGTVDEPEVEVDGWHKSAWHLMFPEAFGVEHVQRPQEHVETFVINVKKNVRLTPQEYSRNVFHIEFDTSDTSLSYNIGEALGVYGHNRKCDVDRFLEMYQLDENDTVSLRTHSGKIELRTVRQVCAQLLDLFGRPSRRFYGALAPFAKDEKQRKKLEWLATDGTAEFKKRVEATVTYASLLREFDSARPSFVELINIVSYIKARHYSIASSSRMHPGEVHLLVVLVDWKTEDGEQRYGQCSKYLADLEVGDEVTVDIMPSVMKLPEDDSKPVVMAGLGTGMAPFRAFIEERAVRAASGIEVGPMALYFGSRSQKEEYLYGEELEAYQQSGLLHVSCAFSRDQEEKIYIQHRMQQDADLLCDYLGEQEGSFYLCGPTWPAGDVQDAIEGAFQKVAKMSAQQASEKVKAMKEDEKYILEVY